MARLAPLIVALLLVGCASDPTVVKVPVIQRAVPPPEMTVPVPPPGRIFTVPGVASVACLDPVGRDALVGYVDLLRQRVAAWEAWAAP
ncbi:hypothetical protein [Azospirillum picis]|uniref:Lipoprotein YmbA n=1 Tax=Azospirillum picis TaxID=488438 RepID=A0ABU0MEA8_9PROT|nr:hypothetical protein [Azospirillum picis]MBP2297936.1 putative lipoprotein YmbA [Azospirillum picis]MDQ0531774.1 putative lipoprotein YmbA [Azospirillum picis]